MEPLKFKEISEKIKKEFIRILTNESYLNYSIFEPNESPAGQYWSIKTTYAKGNSEYWPQSIIFHIKCQDFHNKDITVNDFFKNNDDFLDEIGLLEGRNKLVTLKPIFLDIEQELEGDDDLFTIDIDAKFGTKKQFMGQLLDEFICIIHLHENEMLVECMQNQRKTILVPSDDGNISYSIPFDKVHLFPNAFQHPVNPRTGEDENYIFVLMSFQEEPHLIDAYDAIERAVKQWNTDASIQRVDCIKDDYKINEKILECIDKAGLVIADLTGERPNVYYELGYSRAKGKRLIQTSMTGTILHFDVREYNTIMWDCARTLEKSLIKRLNSMFRKRTSDN